MKEYKSGERVAIYGTILDREERHLVHPDQNVLFVALDGVENYTEIDAPFFSKPTIVSEKQLLVADPLLFAEHEKTVEKINALAARNKEMEEKVKEIEFLRQTMVRISALIGIESPMQLICRSTNNEETYADILVKLLKEALEKCGGMG